jgi:hypothetical protein
VFTYIQTNLPTLVGLIGVSIIVVSYFLLHAHLLKIENLIFSILNAISSVMVLYSLFYEWNTPAVLIECFWLGISFYGVIKVLIKKRKTNREKAK